MRVISIMCIANINCYSRSVGEKRIITRGLSGLVYLLAACKSVWFEKERQEKGKKSDL